MAQLRLLQQNIRRKDSILQNEDDKVHARQDLSANNLRGVYNRDCDDLSVLQRDRRLARLHGLLAIDSVLPCGHVQISSKDQEGTEEVDNTTTYKHDLSASFGSRYCRISRGYHTPHQACWSPQI